MPAVIRTPGVRTSKDSTFDLFSKKSEKRKRQAPLVIEGTSASNGAIGYEGRQDSDQRYCLIVKDEASGRLDLVDAPLFDVTSFVKSVRERDLETTIRQSGVKNWQQRTALGEAFGTKKAKTAINDVSRNRLDADMLEGLETAIVDNVQERTANLPSLAERQKTSEAERPIPAYDADTTVVADIYPLSNIVPPHELDTLAPTVDAIFESEDDEKLSHLPFQNSDFINARIFGVLAEESNVKPRLLVLVYLSFLRAVYEARRASSRTKLMEKIGGTFPSQLYDGVIERFTVSRAGFTGQSRDRSFAFDPYHTDKLLCYMLALMLHADNFEVDVTPLAHELSTKTSKLVNLFRNLGCKVGTASAAEAKARDLTRTQAATYRIAVLTAPLSLPDIVKRKRD